MPLIYIYMYMYISIHNICWGNHHMDINTSGYKVHSIKTMVKVNHIDIP
jgi:hypothetical protein